MEWARVAASLIAGMLVIAFRQRLARYVVKQQDRTFGFKLDVAVGARVAFAGGLFLVALAVANGLELLKTPR